MQRIKLFSNTRVKLFSQELRTVKCADCGHTLKTAANVSQIFCPNCGGKRFNVVNSSEEVIDNGNDLKESELTANLKKFSGEIVSKDIFEKTFSEDLVEKGYASILENGDYRVSPYAYETEKLFSKLTITVTKEIDLDPSIMSGAQSFENAISEIKGPEKGIMIIRKAHGILEPKHTEMPSSSWIEDSHIIHDLRAEYGGETKGIKQFMDILSDRYPDAPEDIVDDLVSRGAITINGNQITVNK